ncbi:hypothetical protein BYT27DRAFT_7192179 [Phlegmacium glaucopus]|nr:hypothetical protein BYT27DRAFT_7192179 [Phlegmacium glaucopus]
MTGDRRGNITTRILYVAVYDYKEQTSSFVVKIVDPNKTPTSWTYFKVADARWDSLQVHLGVEMQPKDNVLTSDTIFMKQLENHCHELSVLLKICFSDDQGMSNKSLPSVSEKRSYPNRFFSDSLGDNQGTFNESLSSVSETRSLPNSLGDDQESLSSSVWENRSYPNSRGDDQPTSNKSGSLVSKSPSHPNSDPQKERTFDTDWSLVLRSPEHKNGNHFGTLTKSDMEYFFFRRKTGNQ